MKTFFPLIALLFPMLLLSQNPGDCNLDLGPDISICNGASFELNPHGNPANAYSWTGPNLTCTNCPTPTISNLTTGVYTVIATEIGAGCVVTDTVRIEVFQGQQPVYSISPNTDICVGEDVQIGGPPAAITTYTWFSDPVGFFSSASNPTVNPTASTTYYIVATNPDCIFASVDSVKIGVFEKPQLSLANDTTICQGQSVRLANTAPGPNDSYLWKPDDGSLDTLDIPNPLATPNATTAYGVTASNPGCTDNGLVLVTVIPNDATFSSGDTLRICLGTPDTVEVTTDPPDATIAWTPTFGLTQSNGGKTLLVNPTETTVYTATLTNGACVRQKKLTVIVDSLPYDLRIFPMDTTICLGSQVLLKSKIYEPAEFREIEFRWEGEGQLTPDTFFNMLVSPPDTSKLIRIATQGACVDTQEVVVNVVVPPMVMITPNFTEICPGESVQLQFIHPPQVTDIMWSPPNGLSCTEDCDNPVATPGSTIEYTVKAIYMKTDDFGGCELAAIAGIGVRQLPQFQFPTDVNLCLGESAQLNEAFADPTATFTWTSTDPAFGTSNSPNPVVSPTSTQTYFMLAENPCKVQGQVTLTVHSATMEAKGDTTICKNFSAYLSAKGTATGTYVWSPGNLNGAEQAVTPSQTTVYTVLYTYGDNCQITDQVTVNVLGEAPLFQFPNDTQLCPGENATLNLDPNPNPQATYTWTSEPPGFTSTLPNPSVKPSVTTKYKVTSQLGICTNAGEITITAHSATLTASKDTTVCEGTSAELKSNGTGQNSEYFWTPGGTNANFTTAPLSVNTNFKLTYRYGDNCFLYDSVLVKVVKNISVDILCDPDTSYLEVGTPIQLEADVSPNQSLNGFKFLWREDQTDVGTAQKLDVESSRNLPENLDEQTFTYRLLVTSNFGCTATAEKPITFFKPLFGIPNAFTPGPDTINSTFSLVPLKGTINIEKMEIYTRWGEKIFESKEPNARWDGTDGNGNDLPSDVYVYVIVWRRYDGALQPTESGEVLLLR